jgi:hypothetical protein
LKADGVENETLSHETRHPRLATSYYRLQPGLLNRLVADYHLTDILAGDEMPRIPPQLLDASFYLYPSSVEAKAGVQAGGTGVFVAMPVPNFPGRICVYAVSNKHVVNKLGCSVIRVNTLVGGTDIIEKDPAEWHASNTDDLAVCLIQVKPEVHKIKAIGTDIFVKKQELRDDQIGVGDDVFMVGRFMNHDGHLTNVPSVRFGHLSMAPLEIRHEDGYMQMSFAVEMLSRPGYSGSPVYGFRVPYDMLTGNIMVGGRTVWFLGINWGFVTDSADVKEKIVTTGMVADDKSQTMKYVRVNTGMNGVIPAWHVEKFLNSGRVKREREAIFAQEARAAASIPPSGVAQSAGAPPASDANPTHREDFTRLLGAAAQTPVRED